jgi:hypothetical protein
MNQNIDRLIDLVKKTGDKMVIVSREEGEPALILMSLSDYEKLVFNRGKSAREGEDLTIYRGQDKIEKVNQDIAILQEKEKKEALNEAMLLAEEDKVGLDEETEGQFYFEPIE